MIATENCRHSQIRREWDDNGLVETCFDCHRKERFGWARVAAGLMYRLEVAEKRIAGLESAAQSHPEGA